MLCQTCGQNSSRPADFSANSCHSPTPKLRCSKMRKIQTAYFYMESEWCHAQSTQKWEYHACRHPVFVSGNPGKHRAYARPHCSLAWYFGGTAETPQLHGEETFIMWNVVISCEFYEEFSQSVNPCCPDCVRSMHIQPLWMYLWFSSVVRELELMPTMRQWERSLANVKARFTVDPLENHCEKIFTYIYIYTMGQIFIYIYIYTNIYTYHQYCQAISSNIFKYMIYIHTYNNYCILYI